MKRFFSDDSFWNQPIPRLAVTDPSSDEYLQILSGEHGGPFFFNMTQWTIPVYEVTADTPRRRMHQWRPDPVLFNQRRWGPRDFWFRHGRDFEPEMPIPDNVKSDPFADAHMAMVDWSAGKAWDMWGCFRRPDGSWESKTGMTYSLHGPGLFKTEELGVKDGESVHFYGPGRAAGVPIIAGLALHDEICAGAIRHKLAFATWFNAYKKFVFPAAWTDGFRDRGLPEGAVLQLDPSLDPAPFDLTPAGRVIFRALQEYGMVNVDNARGNVIYLEGLYGQAGKSWEGLIGPRDFFRIPLQHYRVLKLENIVCQGDTREASYPH